MPNKHVLDILESLHIQSHTDNVVKLVTECGQHVSVPLPLICLAWPGLANMVQDVACCSDVTILVPGRKQTVLHVLKMLYTGTSSPVSSSELESVRNFCTAVGLNWNIEGVEFGVRVFEDEVMSDNSDTFILKECFSDDEEVESSTTFQNPLEGAGDDSNADRSMLCSRNCLNKCAAITASWSKADLLHVKTMLKSDKPLQSRINLINHLQAQENVGVDTDNYFINGHEFCINFLRFSTGISDYILRSVLEDYSSGIRMYEHASKGVIQQQSLATMQFISWFKQFVQIYGQDAPDDNVTVLAYWLKRAALFNIYKEEASLPHVAQATFYQHMKLYFGHQRIDKTLPCVRISKYTTHSVCDICVALNTNQRQCQTEAELKFAKSLRNQHRMEFGQARRAIEEIKQTSISFPADNLFIQVDGMDNSKSYLPRFLENAKELVGAERLPSKIYGCIITSGFYEGNQKILFFINHDHFGKFDILVIINSISVPMNCF